MKPKTRAELEALFAEPLSFYQQADAVVRLFAEDEVAEVIAGLPAEFRQEFLEFSHEAYAPPGERLVVKGPPIPAACLTAFRDWLVQREEPQRKLLLVALSSAVEHLTRTVPSLLPPGKIPNAPVDLHLVETQAQRGQLPRQPAS